jgi:H+/Cl- antiporter ClcA
VAEIDKQKEWVSFWKTAFFSVMGIMFGLFGYIFQTYKRLNDIEKLVIILLIVILVISSILILKKLKREIEKLGDM